ncbi:linear amide C-N hydrolase [Desulfovibrio sp. OttesenSCG-928-G15]|nr:linear amide C-N hydrolase [Desulfovibrio sp. OttesenSCG-928-G15]
MRQRKYSTLALAAALIVLLSCGQALACSWAAFCSGSAAVVGRTMDWVGRKDEAQVMGIGRGVAQKTAESGKGLEYTTQYASIRITSFGGLSSDVLNEKGLQGSVLYLEGSRLPGADQQKALPGMDPLHFISYAASTCATVKEVILTLGNFHFLPRNNPMVEGSEPGYDLPFHYAFADASGDKAVIEFEDGKLVYYHGPENDALANDPHYSAMLALDEAKYQPNGSIISIDRRARAKLYLKDMTERGVDSAPRAMRAMRGLLATVFAGLTESYPTAEGGTYHTQWWTLTDLKNPTYYLTRLDSWCAEIYDFSLFPKDGFTGELKPLADCPYKKITPKQPVKSMSKEGI